MTKEEALVEQALEVMKPHSWSVIKNGTAADMFSATYNFHLMQLNDTRRLAVRLVEAGWRPTS
jgi:hypothetical protein